MRMIDKLSKELLHTPETTLFGKFRNIVFGAATYITWATIVIGIYRQQIPEWKDLQIFAFAPSESYKFISMCLFAPICEEILFRMPLSIVKKWLNQDIFILYCIILSSMIFGYMHKMGVWSIPIQGVAGLLFCYVYLKNGYSYVSSVLMHFIINFYYFLK